MFVFSGGWGFVFLMCLLVLGLFGGVFVVLLGHEFVHLVQSEKPVSLCWSLGDYEFVNRTFTEQGYSVDGKFLLWAKVVHDPDGWDSRDDFARWGAYTEKWAMVGNYFFYALGCLFFGFFGGWVGWRFRNRKKMLRLSTEK